MSLVFSWMVSKIEPTHIDYLCRDQMKSESDLILIWNCRVNSDDFTLVEPISNDFTNRRFMIFIWIFIDCVLIMIANSYHEFEAFSIKTKSSSMDIVKDDVMFLR